MNHAHQVSPKPGLGAPPSLIFFGTALVLGLFAYAPSFNSAILPDDVRAILENPSIRSLWPLSGPLSPSLGNSLSGRPVANLTFALNYAASGFHPFSYHLVNFLIHLFSSVTLFAILRRVLAVSVPKFKPDSEKGSRSATLLSGFVSLAWLLHPIATQAVTHLTQRVESLMIFFFFLCFYFSLRGFSSAKKYAWHIPALAVFLLGLGTKEVMVAAPPLVLLYRLVIDGKPLFRELRSNFPLYAGFAAGLVLMAFHVSRGEQLTSASAPYGRLDYLVTQAVVIFHYLKLVAAPYPLCYDYRLPMLGLLRAWPFAVAAMALTALTIWLCLKRKPVGFALAWFLVTLLPTSSILPLPQPMTDYRPLLGSAGILAAFAACLYEAAVRLNRKSALVALISAGIAIIMIFGALTYLRNLDYKTSITLWADTARKRPKNYMAHHNLGNALAEAGRPDLAAGSFETATTYNPLYFEAYLSWGVALARLGKLDEAREKIERAIAIKPDYAEAWMGLGALAAFTGKTGQAISYFERAIAIKPDYVNAHLNLGLALRSLKRRAEAIRRLETALALAPDRADIRAELLKTK